MMDDLASTREALGLLKTFQPPTMVQLERRNPTESLGMHVEYMASHGLPEVTGLVAGGVVEATGHVCVGDVITTANGVDAALGPTALVAALNDPSGVVLLVIRRPKPPTMAESAPVMAADFTIAASIEELAQSAASTKVTAASTDGEMGPSSFAEASFQDSTARPWAGLTGTSAMTPIRHAGTIGLHARASHSRLVTRAGPTMAPQSSFTTRWLACTSPDAA